MSAMAREEEFSDLRLIVRALHRDVSMLDDRLRRLESEIGVLRAATLGHPDLVVFPSRDARAGA